MIAAFKAFRGLLHDSYLYCFNISFNKQNKVNNKILEDASL